MRIRIKDVAKLQPDKMAKIALAATPRALLDLYCVAPGQEQKPHTHGDQDKFYVVLEGRGRFRLGAAEHALEASALAREASQLAARTHEFSQFLVRVLGVTDFTAAVPGRVTYHDSCHLLRGLHESQSPRTLLGKLKGAELVPLPGADECCGFGGSFAVRLPEVSSQILAKKLANVEATGADCLVACDAGCLMQMGGGRTRKKSRVRALHLAELLDGSP